MIKKLFTLAVSAFVLVGCSQFKGGAPIPHFDLGIKVVDAEGNNLVGSAMYGDSVKGSTHKTVCVKRHVFSQWSNLCKYST